MYTHGQTLTLISITTDRDPLDNSTTTRTEREWGPCAIAPRESSESNDPTTAPVIVGYTIYGPTTDIDSDDLVLIDGELWQVDGLPGKWRSPFTGWDPGIELRVKRAQGV